MEKETYNPQIDEFINEEEQELEKEVAEEEHRNPLQGLVDIYNEMVAEQDKKGFGEIFKNETDRFFKKMDEFCKEYLESSFTPVDVEYGDGYFIFGHGSNSVIHFHLKEAPGWLFGIWWSPLEIIETRREGEPEQYHQDRIKCEFFAQFEETIDKFKPAASMFEEGFDWDLKDKDDENSLWRQCYEAHKVIKLILKYPYVAFVREIHWGDLNVDYVTPEEAEQIYTEWKLRENAKKLMEQQNTRTMIECLDYIFKPIIEEGNAFIHDSGPNVNPRYELVLRNVWKDDQGQEDSADGCYGMFDFGVDWPDKEEDKAKWDAAIKECEARAKELKTYWFNPVSRCVIIVSGEKFYKWKEEEENRKHD